MQILNRVDQLTKVLHSLQPIPADRKNILDKKFRLEFNYNSNHIEGNTLTYGETELLLIFDDTKGNHQMREYEEMKAHDVAYKMVEEWATEKERPITEQQIKNLNEIILVRPFWKDAITSDGQSTRRQIKIGDYKDMPNSVRLQNGEIFEYASPIDTPIKMQELIDWFRKAEGNSVHPVTLAAMLHYNFVRIHPFDDGNGRIARLLLNYVLLKNNLPPVIIKSADKANYLRALNRADIGDTDAFVEYIGEQLIWSLDISIKAAKGESIDEPGDLDKKLDALKKRMGKREGEKVEVTYGLKAAIDVVENLGPLIERWERKLKEFDIFFYGRVNDINIIDDQASFSMPRKGNDLYGNYDLSFKDYFGRLKNSTKVIHSITIEVVYTNLKEVNKHGSYNGGMLSVYFHSNAYEILIDKRRFKTKLYNEIISEEEILSAVEIMGNSLINTIEKELEEK